MDEIGRRAEIRARLQLALLKLRADKAAAASAAGAGAAQPAEQFYGPPPPLVRRRFRMPPAASADEKDAALRSDVLRAINDATPQSTAKTYATYQKQYNTFCHENGIEQPLGAAFPTQIAAFILSRSVGPKALALSTLKGPVRAALGALKPIDDERATQSQVVRKALYAASHTAPNPKAAKLPLPPEMLTKIVTACWTAKSHIGARDATMFIWMTFGLLRRSEAVQLLRGDVTRRTVKLRRDDRDATECVELHVRKAKNDQQREGSRRLVPAATDRKSPLCPVGALLRLNTFAAPHGAETPVFLNLSEESRKRKYPYRAVPSVALAAATPNKRLKHWLKQCGVSDSDIKRYGSHSLRKCGATTAFAAGIARLTIQRAGAWRSDAVDAYITVNEQEHTQCWRQLIDSINDDISDSDDDE